MKTETRITRRLGASLALALAFAAAMNVHADSGVYVQHNLVSDGFLAADNTDPNLVNAWGIALSATSPMWVADNGSGLATVYGGDGVPKSLIVQIPTPTDLVGGTPTGIVFNGSTTSFVVSGADASGAPVSGPSHFIFATEDGVIAGWTGGTQAFVAVDNSMTTGAIYKGLALVALNADGTGQQLYATDFHNARIDVFDSSFAPVTTLASDAFTDPKLPPGFAPFGIQAIGGNLFVTYAKQQAGSDDEAHGQGLGFVDAYDANGGFLSRVAQRGLLNAPWGVALAPAGFGKFSNSLLVGNFGDGSIVAYDTKNFTPQGQLHDQDGHVLHIDGLWGIAFGNDAVDQPSTALFFAAGPDDEQHGLYGRIDAAQ
ncbi:MAG TPA: TIGR03118 family protein [Rudaea sp.]|jgi:uncharacterized protein (TIGR03118 family)